MVYGAILAGGTGSRMGAEIPKQFLALQDGRPILIRTLQPFLKCPQIEHILLAVHADWLEYTKRLLHQWAPKSVVVTCFVGGSDRNETMGCILQEMDRLCAAPDSILVTHDGVRPFVTVDLLERSIAAARQYGAAIAAIPAVDTIAQSEDGLTVSGLLDRSKLIQVQTPQTFQFGLLRQMYRRTDAQQLVNMTDAGAICVAQGQPVHLVTGSRLNLKITTPEDLKMAEWIDHIMADDERHLQSGRSGKA